MVLPDPTLVSDDAGLRAAVAVLLSARQDVRAVAADTGLSKTTVAELRGRRRSVSRSALAAIVDRYAADRSADWERAWQRARAAAPSPRSAPPRELPLDVAGFTGRTRELAALEQAAAVPGAVVTITGTAGVGKTTLAVHWAHAAGHRYPDGSLYVDLHGYDEADPTDPRVVLAALLPRLGAGPVHPGSDLDALAACYRTALAGRHVLVVLDNVHDTDQLVPLLPGEMAGTVLVTSRDSLAPARARYGLHRLPLDVLPPDEAVDLLRRELPEATPADDTLAALAEQCARLPLALRLAAGVLVEAPDPPADTARTLLAAPAGPQPPAAAEHADALAAAFSSSYRHLDSSAAAAFRLLGVHPTATLELPALAALRGDGERAAGLDARRLVRAGLLRQQAAGRYAVHDLLHRYAADLLTEQEPPAVRRQALARLLDHYTAAAARADGVLAVGTHPGPDFPAAVGWLDANRLALVRCAGEAVRYGLDARAADVADALWRYLHRGGHQLDAVAVHAEAAAALHRAGDLRREAVARDRLAIAQQQLARYPQALASARAALALSRQAGDRATEAAVLGHLGTLRARTEDNDEALAHFAAQRRIAAELDDRGLAAIASNNSGLVLLRSGRYADAIEPLSVAATAARELRRDNDEAIALNNLGLARQHAGDTAGALTALDRALRLVRALGNRAVEAQVHDSIGVTHARRGDLPAALDALDTALRMHREHHDRAAEAETLDNLGSVLHQAGRPAEALPRHREALAIAREIGEPGRVASAEIGGAVAARALGDLVGARAGFETGLGTARQVGNLHQQARALAGLSALAGDAGDGVTADRLDAESRALRARTGAPDG
jgi:tetratricopeptide (TPR) repeat protein